MSAVHSPPAEARAPARLAAPDQATAAEITASPLSAEAVELLAWVAGQPRTYAEAMAVWQTSCPRHSVWEDVLAEALIQVTTGSGPSADQAAVTLTRQGRTVLAERRADFA